MRWYIARRLGQMAFVFIGVTFIIFVAVFLLPGNPVAALAGNQPLPASVIHDIELKYHLTDPVYLQYWLYVVGLLHGNLGYSLQGQSVSSLLAERWPVTATLALTAWVFEIVMGVAIGLLSGLRRGGAVDRTALFATTLAVAVPTFVVGFTAQIVLGIQLHLVPVEGIESGWPASYVVPALALGAFGTATVGRLTRAAVLDTSRSDYVRMAIAKGLPTRLVVGKHILKNASMPVITYLGLDLGFLLGGAIVIEGIFNLPGIGQLLFNSIQIKDSAVVVGIGTLLVLIFLLGNLVVDILYAFVDPRVHYE